MRHTLKTALLGTALLALTACATSDATSGIARPIASPVQASDSYFVDGAQFAATHDTGQRARNVILFVGDGMGVTTITAARIFAGQSRRVDGESYDLAMDTFPHVALSRTYGHDAQISDSAPTATALLSGVKTNNGIIGLTQTSVPDRCDGPDAHRAETLFEMAEEAGLATGIISTARITHATPAAAYAHVAGRDWENDVIAARNGGANCTDIARQLLEWPAGDGFEIVLGGGRANFMPNTAADPETASARGARADGRNLIEEWQARSPAHAYVWNAAQFNAANFDSDARVLGLFSPSHMAYDAQRAGDAGGEPSLAEMTAAAIRRLSRDTDGYVLLVEGGRIDHGHHERRAGLALSDAVAMDDAIRTALELTSRDDTLIVVTADHSHTLTMSGYAARGTPILGLSSDGRAPVRASDGLPYTTLGYMNGPGAVLPPAQNGQPLAPTTRPDLTGVDTQALDHRQQALVPMFAETHGGEDVAVFAAGPNDASITGVMEQHAIFHVMARALGFTYR